MKNKLTVAFDVDDTLIKEGPHGRELPNHNVIDLLRWFQRNGHHVIVWSGGGIEYANRVIERFNLYFPGNDAYVVAKGSVPVDIAVDDGGIGLGAEEQVFNEIKNSKVTILV